MVYGNIDLQNILLTFDENFNNLVNVKLHNFIFSQKVSKTMMLVCSGWYKFCPEYK